MGRERKEMRNHSVWLVLLLVLCLAGCATTQPVKSSGNSAAYDAEYLTVYFGIKPFAAVVDGKSYDAAMLAVSGEDFVDEASFTPLSAVVSAVKASSLDELAQTYSDKKALKRVKGLSVSGDDAKYLACALDAGLVCPSHAKEIAASSSLSSAAATELVMAVAGANGKGPNALGYSDDADIEAKLANAFSQVELYRNDELDAIGAKLVETKVSTGYNLKKTTDSARFLPSLTLRYGHDSGVHAKQLIALLNSEDIRVRIQIEPKTSIYQYLLEWGPVPEPSPNYRVEKYSDDLYLVYATEYDMEMEFASAEDLKAFNAVMEKYSKKNDANQKEGSGVKLISGAWWQPLYSATFNPSESDYKLIYDNVLTSADGAYSIHPFSLPEGKDALEAKEAELSGRSAVAEKRYVNNAFYRYLTGEDHQ
jgi:hypothetical protein